MPDHTSPTPKIKKILRYDLAWMDSTFLSKSTTEALLSPERETGHLSVHDYDASVVFFSNYHRRYPIMGTLAATALIYSIRNPKWNQMKSAALVFAFGLAGHGFGRISSSMAHFNYVRSLDNPYGFQKAMEHVQAQVGAPKAGHGLVLEWPYEVSPDDLDPDEKSDNSLTLMLPTAPDSQSEKVPSPNARTKWDEIRSASNRTAPNSTWDTIRQKHERKNINSPPKQDETLWADNPAGKADMDRYANPDTYDEGDKYSGHQKTSPTR